MSENVDRRAFIIEFGEAFRAIIMMAKSVDMPIDVMQATISDVIYAVMPDITKKKVDSIIHEDGDRQLVEYIEAYVRKYLDKGMPAVNIRRGLVHLVSGTVNDMVELKERGL